MVTVFVMPRYSLTMKKGRIVRWLKKEGEPVKKGEPIVEIEADKVTTEVEAPDSGILLKICVPEDAEVPVSKPIAFIGESGEPIPEVEVIEEEAVERKYSQIERSEAVERIKREKRVKVRASPLARRLAREHGIDLTQVVGTGPGGKITREDVLKFIEIHKDTRTVKEVFPLKGMQKTIAERMSNSIKRAAHCSITIEVDASGIRKLRESLNAKLEGETKVSYTAIIVKAVALALREHPLVNSTLEDGVIKIFEDINIGVAVEVGEGEATGLMVPVIHKADEKSILEINAELERLIERARMGKLLHGELSGGTFTITNLGMYDVNTFTPIINPPETAILGIGAIVNKPVVVGEKIEVRPIMNLTLSFDHRVLNGAPAARFLRRLKQILESIKS